MEENIFDAIPGFDRLLEQKSFEALTGREREQVLQYISPEDYSRFRQAILVAQHERLKDELPIVPDPSVKSRLMQRSGAGERPPFRFIPPTFSRILGYRIPAYQAGLAASVLLFLVFYLLLQKAPVPARLAIADTVYVDRPVLLKDTVWLAPPPHPPLAPPNTPSKPGTPRSARQMPENQFYASQMQDALVRMSVISGLGKEKSVNNDARLLKLVATGPATLPSP
jgi:hypothetical protein